MTTEEVKQEGKPSFKEFANPSDASVDKLVAALDRAYHRPVRMFFRSFFQGLAAVLGGTIGASLVFALLFFTLRTFDFSPLAERIQNLVIPQQILNELDAGSSSEDEGGVLSPTMRSLLEESAQRAYLQGVADGKNGAQ